MPNLKAPHTQNFQWLTTNSINFGQLHYSETIATEKAHCERTITLEKQDLIAEPILKTFTNNQRILEHNRDFKYLRKIEVVIFPHKVFLKSYENEEIGKDFILSSGYFSEKYPKISKILFDSNLKF